MGLVVVNKSMARRRSTTKTSSGITESKLGTGGRRAKSNPDSSI